MKPITIKIDVSKVDKTALFKGSKGTYLDLCLWPNKDGQDRYGSTHYVVQQLSKERRDKGERGAILGNATVPPQDPVKAPAAKLREALEVEETDSTVPF